MRIFKMPFRWLTDNALITSKWASPFQPPHPDHKLYSVVVSVWSQCTAIA